MVRRPRSPHPERSMHSSPPSPADPGISGPSPTTAPAAGEAGPARAPGPTTSEPPGAGVRRLLLALFFLSGACGLIYEVVWMRMLTLVFGATAFATSTILASFFAGLAVGSFWFGRVVDRGRDPLKVYALLEVGVGVFAFLMPVLFAGITVVYVAASRALDLGYYPANLLRFVLAFGVLVVPAALLGGTLPAVVRFFVRRPDGVDPAGAEPPYERLGWNVGLLYAVNTFGAVVGTVAAGFFLILLLGVRETAYVAGVVNLVIAAVVWMMARRMEEGREGTVPGDTDPPVTGAGPLSPGLARLALWAVGVSGFCALALEVLWTRALVFFLDISTHAFTTILTAFLVGIALGSLAVARLVDRRRRLLAWLGGIVGLLGVTAVLALPTLNHLTPVLERMMGMSLDAALPWKWAGMRFLTALAVVLVPCVLAGMTLPVVTRIYTRSVEVVGASLGTVYAVNTLGGVLGSVAAGFLLIPAVGVQNGVFLVAGIAVLLGGILVTADPLTGRTGRWGAAAGTALLLGLGTAFAVVRGPTVLTSWFEGRESVEVLSYDERIGATVKVFENATGERQISVDGFPVAGETVVLQDIQKALGHLPLLLSDVPSPRVNIVGFGAGGTSWAVTLYDPAVVECVELVPAVPDAAGWFEAINHGVLDDPRYTLIRGDGRNHALVSVATYDVITIDATSPKMAGNGSLYAFEFYSLMKERLSERGILVQWLPLHLLSPAELRMTARTFMEAFPHTTLWLTPLRQYGILVGTQEELRIDAEGLRARLERPEVLAELAPLAVRDVVDVLSWFVMGEDALARYAEGARINTDNHPYLEFSPAMAYFTGVLFQARNTQELAARRESVVQYLVAGETRVAESDPGASEVAGLFERVERRHRATELSLRGDILILLGRRDEAIMAYRRAMAIDPGDKGIRNPIWWGGGTSR